MSKTYRIERVKWNDSCGRSRWAQIKEYGTDDLSRCESVGYRIHSKPDRVTLVQSLDSTCDQADNSIVIPRVAVSSIEILGKVKFPDEERKEKR